MMNGATKRAFHAATVAAIRPVAPSTATSCSSLAKSGAASLWTHRSVFGAGNFAMTRTALHQRRNIAIGTDMCSSVISLQTARPWYQCDETGSNEAVDNAVNLNELFAPGKTVALFGVPAPFTGVCTHTHYPAYQVLADEFLANGCDEIVCYAVSDPYAMHGWATALHNDDNKIRFLTDDIATATFAKAYGVDRLYDACSLGVRSERFSMLVQDGIVVAFRRVTDPATDAQELLNDLKELKEHQAAETAAVASVVA